MFQRITQIFCAFLDFLRATATNDRRNYKWLLTIMEQHFHFAIETAEMSEVGLKAFLTPQQTHGRLQGVDQHPANAWPHSIRIR
ncbi:hypothetical protein PHET_02920 [Paragonimus heterotremus]|uniref:Uncharacterized protein n=1 Tax=Paragonimus heterotremus TaxID=100268 RepID=A0A8J4T3Q5_9TREM|nr:hypothetical protein PHET_02920 [Paragonimus heterotremus]